MNKETLICIGAILIIFYFASPVPYCRISEEIFCNSDAMYTASEILEVGAISAIQLHVTGTSMLPTIQDNSECLCIKKESYAVGDIIFFFAEMNGQFRGISHRIVLISGDKVITKGDGNDFLDPPMTKKSIVCLIPEVPRYKTFT